MMTMLESYVNGIWLTTVQADGIILSTPTGSTAYNVSAGGPMLLPTVPALCFTPICPHSLSFRPVLIPDSATITILVPEDARGSAFASTDGRNTTELKSGDRVSNGTLLLCCVSIADMCVGAHTGGVPCQRMATPRHC